MKQKNVFNGHTWIVCIIAIIAALLIALAEIGVGYLIVRETTSLVMRGIIKLALITVPLQMGAIILRIIKRLTYVPLEDGTYKQTHRKLSWKERFTGHIH